MSLLTISHAQVVPPRVVGGSKQAACRACFLLSLLLCKWQVSAHPGVVASTGCGVQAAPRALQTPTAGAPPHQAWRLPNDAQRQWYPFAIDGHARAVLMIWEPGFSPARMRQSFEPNPIHMALVHLGSHTLEAIPEHAYPHFGILGRWRLEWPWIVGLKYTTPMGPRDWVLWAGNVATGDALILDQANPGIGPSTRTPPEFSLDQGRVAWNHDVRDRASGVFHSDIALYDLTRRLRMSLSPGQGDAAYEQPSLSGNTIVWVSLTPGPKRHGHPVYDLMLLDLHARTARNLTQNTQGARNTGVSLEPSLQGHLLAFKQAPSPYGPGDVVLWDLRAPSYPLWNDQKRQWLLDRAGEAPLLGDGIVSWNAQFMATAGVADLRRGRVWRLQDPTGLGKQTETYRWTLTFVSGRYILARRDDAQSQSQPAFFVWRIMSSCP